jgi:hypothetical protein
MRRTLTLAAVAAVAAAPLLALTPASALPPDCERYGDKPCFTFCEIWHELEPLFSDTPVTGC